MNICPICTGQPGAKPLLPNKEAINKVIQIALILGCKINNELVFQRKHYSWPDLPKGYQITISGPHAKPVGEHGKFLGIGITEAHLEEDPAAWNPKTGEIDYNRSGFPLVEIVTEPDFTSSEQVVDWLKQLIATLGYIKAIDKKMGIKSDVNVSVEGGARIEVKNVNSINNIKNTIEHEIERQTKNLPKVQETRRYDETKGITTLMRTKEQAQDYRFITEPDLPVINLSNKLINELKNSLPETPQEKLEKLIKKYKIEKKYAEVLTKKIEIVEFFEKIIPEVEAKLATRWVTEELLSVLNYNKIELDEIELNSKHFIELLKLIENKTITELKAKDILRSWKEKSESPNIKEISNISNDEIQIFAKKVINENEKAVSDYKNGEAKAINFLIGQVMKLSNKRADFNTARITLEKLLK